MKIRRLIISVSLLAALAGCSSAEPAAPSQAPGAPAPVATVAEVADPESIEIPDIGASSTLEPLGLAPDGSHEIPPLDTPLQAGWYEGGPEPGEPGPAIVLGHIDGRGQQGIFWRLKELQVGDLIKVKLKDGAELNFHVTNTEQVSKKDFPDERVYAHTTKAAIRLITCGGAFDGEHYTDNTIVYGVLAEGL